MCSLRAFLVETAALRLPGIGPVSSANLFAFSSEERFELNQAGSGKSLQMSPDSGWVTQEPTVCECLLGSILKNCQLAEM